ncbi:MAG: WD40-repeat-containing domain protein, partial [Benniella sp.]
TVRLWDVKTGACIHVMAGHSNEIHSVVYSPEEDQLASAGDEIVRLWDMGSGACHHTLRGHSESIARV